MQTIKNGNTVSKTARKEEHSIPLLSPAVYSKLNVSEPHKEKEERETVSVITSL